MPPTSDPTLWTTVDQYFNHLLIPADPTLDDTLRASAAAGLPEINVAPNQGKFLQLLARLSKARTALEIGTLGGYSTIWIARGLAAPARVVTLELDPKHAEVARANFQRAGLASTIELKLGRAADTLAQLAAANAGPFDFIFIDADKASMPEYFTWSLKLSRPGTVIVLDNVVRSGAVVDATTTDPNVQGVQKVHALISRTPQVTATTLQTVGTKGHDGFTLVLVHASPSA